MPIANLGDRLAANVYVDRTPYIIKVYIPEGSLTGTFSIYLTFDEAVQTSEDDDTIDPSIFDLEGVEGAVINSVIPVSDISVADEIEHAIETITGEDADADPSISDIPLGDKLNSTYRLSITVPAGIELSLLNLYLKDRSIVSSSN